MPTPNSIIDFDPLADIYPDKNLSFNTPIVEAPLDYQKPVEDKYILKQLHIDKFTIKRDRILLTPSTCQVCALDLAAFNGLGSWDKVPDDRRSAMLAALKEHTKLVHPTREDLVINKSEMPSSWLGDKVTTL